MKNVEVVQEDLSVNSILETFRRHSVMTSPGRHMVLFNELPDDIGELAGVIQGIAVHEYVAREFYGFDVPGERRSESHLRTMENMTDRLLAIDPRPLGVTRPVEKRLIGVCHHHVLFLLSILRAKGVPARARCGFGSYFNPPYFEDHWICEYWSAEEQRWILADPQFDDVWRTRGRITHDVLDVPRDRFLVAADAWTLCRTGKGDPAQFGVTIANLRGLWFIAGSLVHDAAALNVMEMLPWDVWGAMPRPQEALDHNQLAFFDHLAELTRNPDATFTGLRKLYEEDDRIRVPAMVFNAVLNRPEPV